MAAGMGGGMAVRGACGALIGAVMILGRMEAIEKGHVCPHLKVKVSGFVKEFEALLGSTECNELLEIHGRGCSNLIKRTAKLLDQYLAE